MNDPELHRFAIKYERSLRRREKAQLDLNFLCDCKENNVYPNFVKWKNISRHKKKTQFRLYRMLLNDEIKEKKSDLTQLTNTSSELKQQLSTKTTWMKFKLICFSINRLLNAEKKKIHSRHNKKLQTLLDLKRSADGIQANPNETIVNLTGQTFTPEQLNVLKLGLRHGIATRPNQFEIMAVSEDIWERLNKLEQFKDGRYIQDKVKNALRSFTFNYIDLDLKEYYRDKKLIKTLNELTTKFSILKPDKGNGIVVMNRSDYVKSVESLFTDSSKFKQISKDPTPTRLTSLQNYLCTLLKRGEITDTEHSFLRPKFAQFGRAHGLPKTHKQYTALPKFRPIVDTTNTPHYNVGKFLSNLLNPLTQNEYTLTDSFQAVSDINSIPTHLFAEGYQFVSFDVVSLFTNVPLHKTVQIILNRVFEEKQISTTLTKRSLKKLILDSCNKTAFSFNDKIYEQIDRVSMGSSLGPVLANIILTEFERLIISDLINSGLIKFYRRYVDDTLLLVKPNDVPFLLTKFNSFHKNLVFTVDKFENDFVHFLDIKISADGTDVFRKSTHTGQYTHFSSFEPFGRKTAWIKSLFHRAFKICSSKTLFDNQIATIKSFMSWNGFPNNVKNRLINRLITKHATPIVSNNVLEDVRPKIWIRIPYLGIHGERLVKTLLKKIQRCLKVPVKFIVIYNTKKVSYFASNKDKIPNLSRSNVVYQFTCPGCSSKYIGKTDRCLSTRLSEHSKPFKQTNTNNSCISQHLSQCEHADYLINMNNLYTNLDDTSQTFTLPSYTTTDLVFNNTKILHSCRSFSPNILLFLEALYIKYNHPDLNSGLKASKELTLFP